MGTGYGSVQYFLPGNTQQIQRNSYCLFCFYMCVLHLHLCIPQEKENTAPGSYYGMSMYLSTPQEGDDVYIHLLIKMK